MTRALLVGVGAAGVERWGASGWRLARFWLERWGASGVKWLNWLEKDSRAFGVSRAFGGGLRWGASGVDSRAFGFGSGVGVMSRKRRGVEHRKVTNSIKAFNAEAREAVKKGRECDAGPADGIKQALSLAVITHGKWGGEAVVEQALRLLGMEEEKIAASKVTGRDGIGLFTGRVRSRLAQQGVEVEKERLGAVLAAAEDLRRREKLRGERF